MIIRNDNTIEIGNWNMKFNGGGTGAQQISVAHTLSATDWKRVRNINVVIRNDTDSTYYDFSSNSDNYVAISASQFDLSQILSSSVFDTVSFDTATGFNRGWIKYDLI
jgi:hypothetical protein